MRWPLLVILVAALPALEVFVDPAGDDRATGRSAGVPVASLARAAAAAGEGAVIRLKRGAMHRLGGTVELPQGCTLSAYGEGAPPEVTRSVLLPLGRPDPRGLRSAAVPQRVLACWAGGQRLTLARWPDQGWLYAGAGSSPDRLVCPELAKRGARVAGAQVRWRRWSWWWETRPVERLDGSALLLGKEGRFHDPFCEAGSAFYLDDCPEELDQPGEWCWRGGQLRLPPPKGFTDVAVEVLTGEEGLKLPGGTVEGVAFRRFAGAALTLGRSATVRGCVFEQLETDAISGSWDAAPGLIEGNLFREVRNVAIQWNENPKGPGGTRIEGNRFERIGCAPGLGGSGSWHAAGVILMNGNGVRFRRNRVLETGYAGIILGQPGQVVEENLFWRCMATLNDGGAVYANCGGSLVRRNIILDTVGNLETSHPWTPLGHGIWMEFLGGYRDNRILENSIFGSGGYGIFLTYNFAAEVRGNLCVSDRLGGLHLGTRDKQNKPQEHLISGNVLASADAPARLPVGEEHLAEWAVKEASPLSFEPGPDYGKMDNTVLIAGSHQPLALAGSDRLATPAAWLKAEPSWADPAPRFQRGVFALLLANDSDQTATLKPPSGDWRGLDGKPASAGLRLEPFCAVVVVSTSPPPGGLRYVLASGEDLRQGGVVKAVRTSRNGKIP